VTLRKVSFFPLLSNSDQSCQAIKKRTNLVFLAMKLFTPF